MPNVKMSNSWTKEKVHIKNFDTMNFTYNNVNFDVTQESAAVPHFIKQSQLHI